MSPQRLRRRVLRLRIPVAEKAKPRKIEIKTGSSSEQTSITA